MPKNWCFWTVVLEKTLESPLDNKRFKPVNSKGSQSWIIIGRSDAETEAPILWPWWGELTHWKKPWYWERKEKGMTEDKMLGWRHWLNAHEFEQAPGAGEGQGSLTCYSPWGRRVGNNWVTEQQQQSICISESLCCIPETKRTLLIIYTLIWNLKRIFNKRPPKKEVLDTLIWRRGGSWS